ncbi:MAG: DUF1800 domain-containing protein [Anaerolineales bacterium]|nr:DUF1800 domain-containing protein [Anaerolineales bacterium]
MSRLSRRDFLRLAGLVSASAAVSTAAACAPVYARIGGPAEPEAAGPALDLAPADERALNRLTFGPRQAERARVAEIGAVAWVEEQLAPAALDDGPADWRLRRFETLGMKAQDLADLGDQLFDDVDMLSVPDELRQATLLRQVYSRRQLYEVMVEFWSDHFHLSTAKGDCWFLKTVDDREVVRPHALGRFRDLLWASAHSPAMLTYLDNQVNVAGAPNENYARELLELHTLGVDGGYSQADVMDLARALTGWTVKQRFWRGQFTFNPDVHDQGEKRVLGLRLVPAGQAEAEQVVERLATHPATARFISTKLARRLLADEPSPGLVARATAAFLSTRGDILAVLRVLLLDGLLAADSPAAPKFKRPVNFVAAALRQLNAETDAGPALREYLVRMGQPYFLWPTPDGYPDRTAPWAGNLLPRWQFALALVRGEIAGTRVELNAGPDPAATADDVARRLLGRPLATAGRNSLLAALTAGGANDEELPALLAAGCLAAPAFQWR